MRPRGEKPEGKLLTFGSIGWVAVLAILIGALVVWRTLSILDENEQEALGDGKNVETYEFALEPCLVDRECLVAAKMPRNGVRAMVGPEVFTVADMDGHPNRKIRKLLVSRDRIIGVALNGEARAYPLRILDLHEVVNDTLGGVPVAVTYHPLCDSAVVFDRRLDGEVREFRVSGLLWNSSQLLFARRVKAGGESLWSQLQARAITGPAAEAGTRLTVLPCSVVSWGDWKEAHPGTTVIAPTETYRKYYARRTYSSYFGTRKLKFPVPDALYPPPGEGDGWDRVLVARVGGEEKVIAGFDGEPTPEGATEVFHALRWAWHATRPTRP